MIQQAIVQVLSPIYEEQFSNFVRYADDCMIFVKSEKAANRVLTAMTKYLENKLGLKVNAEKSKVSKPTGIKFLGYGFWVGAKGQYKPKPHVKSIEKLSANM